jgi:hypothetical protein
MGNRYKIDVLKDGRAGVSAGEERGSVAPRSRSSIGFTSKPARLRQ